MGAATRSRSSRCAGASTTRSTRAIARTTPNSRSTASSADGEHSPWHTKGGRQFAKRPRLGIEAPRRQVVRRRADQRRQHHRPPARHADSIRASTSGWARTTRCSRSSTARCLFATKGKEQKKFVEHRAGRSDAAAPSIEAVPRRRAKDPAHAPPGFSPSESRQRRRLSRPCLDLSAARATRAARR